MPSPPLVSVIVIFLNEAAFLQDAITSVLAQTHFDWELLLVDDGSTDGSEEIARRHADAHPENIRYFTHADHANRGMSASRNVGLHHARGRYVAYLDADDVWLPHKLASQVAILDAQPDTAMTYGPVQSWSSWTGASDSQADDFTYGLVDHGFRVRADRVFSPPELLCLFLRYESLVPTPSAVMVRKDALERVGGSEDAFRGAYEDGVLYFKIGLASAVFVSTDLATKYRVHPNSCSRKAAQAGTMTADRVRFLEWAEAYVERVAGPEADIRRALRSAFWQTRHPHLHALQCAIRDIPGRIMATAGLLARRVLGFA